jgi:hypothetical protein
VDSLKTLDPNRPIREADIASCAAHVRFQGQSGHDHWHMSAFAVAIGGKADMARCTAHVGF